MIDLLLKNAYISGHKELVSIAVLDGKVMEIDLNNGDHAKNRIAFAKAKKPHDALSNLVCSGFFESHIHLDKACILDRCSIEKGPLDEAVSETGKAIKEFTEEDVYSRASRVVEMAIKKGTLGLRTFVETDLKTQLRSFNAIKKVRNTYAFAIDIQICAFAQEGLTQEMETYALLQKALSQGADLVGGCPYKDDDPDRHIALIFDLAEKFDVNVDFHLDFDLDPEQSSIPKVVEETIKRKYQGRVSIGHVTKLAAMPVAQREKWPGS